MSDQRRTGVLPTGVAGIIVVVFTVAAFFLLSIETIMLNVLALAFLLLSEFVLFGGLIGLRYAGRQHSSVFLNTGITTTLSLYFAATLITSIIGVAVMERTKIFVLIEIAIIALCAIIAIAILTFSLSIRRQNANDAAKVGTNEPKRGGF